MAKKKTTSKKVNNPNPVDRKFSPLSKLQYDAHCPMLTKDRRLLSELAWRTLPANGSIKKMPFADRIVPAYFEASNNALIHLPVECIYADGDFYFFGFVLNVADPPMSEAGYFCGIEFIEANKKWEEEHKPLRVLPSPLDFQPTKMEALLKHVIKTYRIDFKVPSWMKK